MLPLQQPLEQCPFTHYCGLMHHRVIFDADLQLTPNFCFLCHEGKPTIGDSQMLSLRIFTFQREQAKLFKKLQVFLKKRRHLISYTCISRIFNFIKYSEWKKYLCPKVTQKISAKKKLYLQFHS